jgi:hypothetical protein
VFEEDLEFGSVVEVEVDESTDDLEDLVETSESARGVEEEQRPASSS